MFTYWNQYYTEKFKLGWDYAKIRDEYRKLDFKPVKLPVPPKELSKENELKYLSYLGITDEREEVELTDIPEPDYMKRIYKKLRK